MLYLNRETISQSREFEDIGISMPEFDRDVVAARTFEQPTWVHFGAGNLFRCFHAALQQHLLDDGLTDRGIVVVDTWDDEVIEQSFRAKDNLSLKVVMAADGELEKRLIASITESHYFAESNQPSVTRVRDIFANPSLQLVTVTATEKGYNLKSPEGGLSENVKKDIADGPANTTHLMSSLAALLLQRYTAGGHPIAMLSTDNFSRNGDRLKAAILEVATGWQRNGFVDGAFLAYLSDVATVSFPWSMIDRITPQPSASVAARLEADGFGDTAILRSAKHSVSAPFVNTEEMHYLVVEDDFPNGRPPLERAGVYFVDKDTVNKVERMKVCTCLNPLHTAMAIFGCLLGYTSIATETEDPEIAALIREIGYDEGLPVVTDPGIITPRDFLDDVVNKRLPNKGIPDTPQRIAADTSQKLGIRFGETIKLYGADAVNLEFIPLVIAGWCRYLMALDDAGVPFELSPDPMNEYLQRYVAGIKLGHPETVGGSLHPILSSVEIFGQDLYEVGLGDKIESFVREMVAGDKAVRATLRTHLTGSRYLAANTTLSVEGAK